MKHYELEATKEQRKNLKTLADYLSTGNTALKFDMDYYNESTCDASEWECGSVACAAGHGPAAGIEPLEGEDWEDYIRRVFTKFEPVSRFINNSYDWMFSGIWSETDNTPEGAAKRIYYALENGIPEDHWRQIKGEKYIFEKEDL